MVIEFESGLASKDPSKHFYNKRTGEVILAHEENAVGRVKKHGDLWMATVYQVGTAKKPFACANDAVRYIIEHST
jgi:hypothetical protein